MVLMIYKNLFRNPGFALYWLSGTCSSIANFIIDIGLLFSVYHVTGSKTSTALLVAAEMFPYLLFGIIGGAIVSALPKMAVLWKLDAIRSVLLFIVSYLFVANVVSYLSLIILAFIIHTVNCFFKPAFRSVVRKIVIERDYNAANGAVSASQSASALVAPLLAAWISATDNHLYLFFVISGVAYGASCFFILLIYINGHHHTHFEKGNVYSSIISAPKALVAFFRYLPGAREIIILLLFSSVSFAIIMWGWHVGLPFYVSLNNSHERSLYALLLSESAIVMLLTDLTIPYISHQPRLWWIFIGIIALAFGVSALLIYQCIVCAIIAVSFISAGFSIINQVRTYFLMTDPPPELVSSGFSFSASLLFGAGVFSMGIFGTLSTHVTLRSVFLVSSILLFILAIVGGIFYWSFSRTHTSSIKQT